MDLHNAPGVTARELAEAHVLDVKIQHKYCCKAMTYWLDEAKGRVFCLIEAPDRESVKTLHANAHGLVPNEIIEVNAEVVKGFLGRIDDPDSVQLTPDSNLKVFSESAFRVLLVSRTMDTHLMTHRLGLERTRELLLLYGSIVRDHCQKHEGREVYLKDDGFVMSFVSAAQAVEAAMAIRRVLLPSAGLLGLQLAIHGGEPVTEGESLFGAVIRLARFLGSISTENAVMISGTVRTLLKENNWSLTGGEVRSISTSEEAFAEKLVDTLSKHWRDAEFDVPDFGKLMLMSKPQLYRKCMAVAGMSPNSLLKEYRLLQSLELLNTEDRNVAQTTFDAGFSSPSYFTKCFQKRFGLQPQAYMKAAAGN